jgi:hypothetical protein
MESDYAQRPFVAGYCMAKTNVTVSSDMVRRDGAETRKERIEQIAKRILGKLYNGKEISLSREIAETYSEWEKEA